MNRLEQALAVLNDPVAVQVLVDLHTRARREHVHLGARLLRHLPSWLAKRPLPWTELESRLSDLSLALDPDSGVFGYLLARAVRAHTIVEFGTSFGISTIYLALAVRDNGGGRVIGTECVPEKAATARDNLRRAGLERWVELREGDALETLQAIDEPVDFLLNDGFPRFALPVLKLVAPRMRTGALALCGNAAVFPADHGDYVEWVRDPVNGFCSSSLRMTGAGEFSVKIA